MYGDFHYDPEWLRMHGAYAINTLQIVFSGAWLCACKAFAASPSYPDMLHQHRTLRRLVVESRGWGSRRCWYPERADICKETETMIMRSLKVWFGSGRRTLGETRLYPTVGGRFTCYLLIGLD